MHSSRHFSDARKVGKEEENSEPEQCPKGDRGGLAEIAARKKEGKGDRLRVEV